MLYMYMYIIPAGRGSRSRSGQGCGPPSTGGNTSAAFILVCDIRCAIHIVLLADLYQVRYH